MSILSSRTFLVCRLEHYASSLVVFLLYVIRLIYAHCDPTADNIEYQLQEVRAPRQPGKQALECRPELAEVKPKARNCQHHRTFACLS